MVVVVAYDPRWPEVFEELRAKLWPVVAPYALRIEHVGSTSVPGLAAKPVIDIDIMVQSPCASAQVIAELEVLGYVHRGDLGIEGRESMKEPEGMVRHNLYVCLSDAEAVLNHLFLRDYLRTHPEDAKAYGDLKMKLAQKHPDDIESYIEAKSDFILEILSKSPLSIAARERIRVANLKTN